MDRSLRNLLGLTDDGKREYRFVDGEVSREEFEHCRIIDQLLFGDKGFVETLGPTWNLVHDPRFTKIENCFIFERKSVFGGDARYGKQWIDDMGNFSSSISDLEQYSEILGEGRHFCEVVKKNGKDPKVFFQESDEVLWYYIKRECPNYFDKVGIPNRNAKQLFNLLREDLLGLVEAYAQVPLINEWKEVETGDLVEDMAGDFSENPVVFMEVDILEQALTYRASIRATAARILKSLGVARMLEGEGKRLTDVEVDNLLRMVYQSKWPDEKPQLLMQIMSFITMTTQRPFAEREAEQLKVAIESSQRVFAGIRDGSIQQITRYTEPALEIELDEEAKVVQEIMRNPLKQQMFLMLAAIEKEIERCQVKQLDATRAALQPLVEAIAPVFAKADYQLTEEKYSELLKLVEDSEFKGETNLITVEEENCLIGQPKPQ